MQITYKEKVKFGKILKQSNKTFLMIEGHDKSSSEWKLTNTDLENITFCRFIKANEKYNWEPGTRRKAEISFDSIIFKWSFAGVNYGKFALYERQNLFLFGRSTGGVIKADLVKKMLAKIPKVEWAEALLDNHSTALFIRKKGYEKFMKEEYTGPTDDAIYEGQKRMRRKK